MFLDWLCSMFASVTICSPSLVDQIKSKDPKRLGVEASSSRVVYVEIDILEILGMSTPFIILWRIFKIFLKAWPICDF
jgi:hypothetical protein